MSMSYPKATKKLLIAASIMLGVSLSAFARERVFFFAAHPDDIVSSLGTCLLMKDKFEIHVCDYTNGSRGGDPARRRKEENAVCAALGAQVHWYGAINGDSWAVKEEVARLAKLLSDLKPRAVFGHWPLDVHDDHAMSAAVLIRAVKMAKLDCEFYFFEESYDSKGFNDTFYVDITSVAEEKRRLIRLYESQNNGDLMCAGEMRNSAIRGERLNLVNPKTGRSGSVDKFAEAFAPYTGRPQGPIIFAEIPRPTK